MDKTEEALKVLLDEGMAQEANKLLSFAEAEKLAKQGDAVATFALATYYYYGVGVKQTLHSAMDNGVLAAKRGYQGADEIVKRWKKSEKRKNIVFMLILFEILVSMPLFDTLAAMYVGGLPEAEQTVGYVLLIVPIVVGIFLARKFLRHTNVGMLKLNAWHYILLVLTIPLTMLLMAIPYGLLLWALKGYGINN